MIVDISIDQGGCSETSRPTTHADPTYVVHDVVHYCVTNMPGAVARTSTFALNNATLPFILALADKGIEAALADDPHLLDGLNVYKGRIVASGGRRGAGRATRRSAQAVQGVSRVRSRELAHAQNSGSAGALRLGVGVAGVAGDLGSVSAVPGPLRGRCTRRNSRSRPRSMRWRHLLRRLVHVAAEADVHHVLVAHLLHELDGRHEIAVLRDEQGDVVDVEGGVADQVGGDVRVEHLLRRDRNAAGGEVATSSSWSSRGVRRKIGTIR